MCRCVEGWCRGVEVHNVDVHRCRGGADKVGCRGDAEDMQRWCRGGAVSQRCRGADMNME
jgi:Ni/Co efflux regulator RcnB